MPDFAENKTGKCLCGCGLDAPVAANTIPKYGHVKGEYLRYVRGHAFHNSAPCRPSPIRGSDAHNYKTGRVEKKDGYVLLLDHSHHRANNSGYVLEHVIVAEQLTGVLIERHNSVHHVNEIRNDNRKGNLVICENEKYHMLLHRRKRALESCGDVNGVRCSFCKEYDVAENMYIPPGRTTGYHKTCYNAQRKARKNG